MPVDSTMFILSYAFHTYTCISTNIHIVSGIPHLELKN